MQTSLPSPSPSNLDNLPKQHCDNQSNCLKLIQLLVDGEATEEQLEKLKKSMEVCRPCIEMYHLEKEVKALLQERMEKKCCPDKLIATIKSRIANLS
ncbi:hypothetical protein [Arsenicibacter rosenii]|uniref:Anti-sigma factor n=1 Tax=Arsenicibacter rosenii TaxID=1750698 RepID=A0A1S2VQ22_9BACT|nr:hypothetical protein [Arsenicibacter rosenii]OIN60286.1 hypothetical protein BLX24_05500 [Arsenicibacter rosenii]